MEPRTRSRDGLQAKVVLVVLSLLVVTPTALAFSAMQASAQDLQRNPQIILYDHTWSENETARLGALCFTGDGGRCFESNDDIVSFALFAVKNTTDSEQVSACWDFVNRKWIFDESTEFSLPAFPGRGNCSLDAQFQNPYYEVEFLAPHPPSLNGFRPERVMVFMFNYTTATDLSVTDITRTDVESITILEQATHIQSHDTEPIEIGNFNQNDTFVFLIAILGLILSAHQGWIGTAIPSVFLLGKPIFDNVGVDYPFGVPAFGLFFAMGILLHMAVNKFGSARNERFLK